MQAHLHSNATASAAAGGGASSHSSPEANSVKGLLLIVGFLALDGFTSTFQDSPPMLSRRTRHTMHTN